MRAIALLMVVVAAPCLAQPDNPAKTCFDAIRANPEFAPLWRHIPEDAAKPPFAMLVDSAKPTEEERNLIARWGSAREPCMTDGVNFSKAWDPPAVVGVVERLYAKFQRHIADLYAGKLTYGEFNQRRADTVQEAEREEAAARPPERTADDLQRDAAACRFETQRALAGANPAIRTAPSRTPWGQGGNAFVGAMADRDRSNNMFEQCLVSRGWVKRSDGSWSPGQ